MLIKSSNMLQLMEIKSGKCVWKVVRTMFRKFLFNKGNRRIFQEGVEKKEFDSKTKPALLVLLRLLN